MEPKSNNSNYEYKVIEILKDLKQSEKTLMLKAPLMVGVLIAGADGNIDDHEQKKLTNLLFSKARKHGTFLESLYLKLASNLNIYLIEIIHSYSQIPDERNREIIRRLGKLNEILPKVDPKFAKHYYDSLRDIAKKIAKASGGYFGLNSVSKLEKKFVMLSMILDPGDPLFKEKSIEGEQPDHG